MAKKIPISFKETTKEIQLYMELLTKEDRGNWIKDVLQKEINKEKKFLNK